MEKSKGFYIFKAKKRWLLFIDKIKLYIGNSSLIAGFNSLNY
jgi:hypothetical protein